jgi:hypothetical protein
LGTLNSRKTMNEETEKLLLENTETSTQLACELAPKQNTLHSTLHERSFMPEIITALLVAALIIRP